MKKILSLIILSLVLYLHSEPYRVALPSVPGILYRDEQGEPSGFYLDLLEEIFHQEGMEIEWVDGTWGESYSRVSRGELDILPIAAVTVERKEELNFLDTSVITTWSELYISRGDDIEKITDLEEQPIGLVDGDNNSLGFTQYIQDFGIQFEPVSFANHEEAMAALENGEIYAFAGPAHLDHDNRWGFVNSGIYYNAVNSSMAFHPSVDQQVLDRINRRLRTWKNDQDSPYFELLNLYGMSQKFDEPLPQWLLFLTFGLGVVGITGLIFIFLLKFQLSLQKKRILETEAQLYQSKKIEALGLLAGGVAHDFNNMLTGMIGYSELLMDSVEDEELKTYCKSIVEAGVSASELTQQLLSFARKENGPKRMVAIHDILKDTLSLLHHSLDPKIKVKHHFLHRSIEIRGFGSQLQNAFLNIGINAGDAMSHGGILTVSTSVENLSERSLAAMGVSLVSGRENFPPGEYLEIRFTDEGEGIPPEKILQIFEPFNTSKIEGKGTGLGLAAVLGTVKMHQGGIQVISNPGKGSTFRIFLPME